MIHSIFDPAGGNAERSGTAFTPPDADQISHMPEAITNPTIEPVDGFVDFIPPPEQPRVDLSAENGGRLLVIRLTGKLTKVDYKEFIPLVEKAIKVNGTIRMLVLMHHFHGLDAGALWQEIKFDAKHLTDIDRIAMVGETTEQKWMSTLFNPFISADIRYFSSKDAAEAQTWIAA